MSPGLGSAVYRCRGVGHKSNSRRHIDNGVDRFLIRVRRDGFTDVFAYDGKIHPDECGSPVFDTHETFYGINIARFSRTANLAVTAEYIKKFIERASR